MVYNICFCVAFVLLLNWLAGRGEKTTGEKLYLSTRELIRALGYLVLAGVLGYLVLPDVSCRDYDDYDDTETIPDLL
jgi:hypothetical protein